MAEASASPLEGLCKESFAKEDVAGCGLLDRGQFKAALARVFASRRLPQPDDSWYGKVFDSYAPRCGGGGVSLRAMEDAAKQFQLHHQNKAKSGESGSGKTVSDKVEQLHAQQQKLLHQQAEQQRQQRLQEVEQTKEQQLQQLRHLQHQQQVRGEQQQAQKCIQQKVQQPSLQHHPQQAQAFAAASDGYGPSADGYGAMETPPQKPVSPNANSRLKGGTVELASTVMYPMKTAAGGVFEEYDFDKKLGEGSFGQVNVVTHKITGQKRACKRVSVHTKADWRLVDTEIQLLKRLDHPNIMRLSECFVDGQHLYLISELCEGGTLLEGFARHGSEAAAVNAIRQILGATAYCHGRGVIHRDLKPDNALYATKAPDSAVKVIDFGLADFLQRLRAAAGGKPMERAGTLVFMAPEMLMMLGDGNYGEKVDVWAIGCMLYLLITGKHPFWPGRAASNEQIKALICSGQVPDHPNWAAAPSSARDLAMQLLALNPTTRLSAADALRHPWLKASGESGSAGAAVSANQVSKSVFEGLQKYQASSKLKRAILKLLAKEADESRVQSLREQFRALDKHQDGLLTRDELLRGMQQCPEFKDLTPADIAQLLPPELCIDKISCTDFTAALLARQGFGRAEMLAAFRRFDVRREGKISLSALSEVLKNAGPASKLEAFREADIGQDGVIDFEEFCILIGG